QLRAPPGPRRGLALLGRRQLDAGAAGLGKPDGNRLLGRARAVLALADVLHCLADKFTRLRGGRLALALVLAGPFDGFLLRHGSPPPSVPLGAVTSGFSASLAGCA